MAQGAAQRRARAMQRQQLRAQAAARHQLNRQQRTCAHYRLCTAQPLQRRAQRARPYMRVRTGGGCEWTRLSTHVANRTRPHRHTHAHIHLFSRGCTVCAHCVPHVARSAQHTYNTRNHKAHAEQHKRRERASARTRGILVPPPSPPLWCPPPNAHGRAVSRTCVCVCDLHPAPTMPSKKACPAVLVRGLGPSTTDAFLRETASSFVAIQRAFIVRDPATRASRGFGFIQVYVSSLRRRTVLVHCRGRVQQREAVRRGSSCAPSTVARGLYSLAGLTCSSSSACTQQWRAPRALHVEVGSTGGLGTCVF
ncbi:RNA-binding protein, partial [archaeon]